MDDVRVKTLDKKIIDGDTSWLLLLVLAAVVLAAVFVWGGVVFLIIENLAKMGVVDQPLEYLDATGFGVLLLAAFWTLGGIWSGK